jgi:Ca2+-binding RTX toxin-like protein
MITVSNSTSAAELQSIIDAAPAGETIVLGAGHFTFENTVVIDRDDIAVTGTGSGVTTIDLIGNARAGGAFQIGSPIDEPTYGNEYQLGEDAAQGSMYLHLADTTGLEAGDFLWIEMPNTDEYLDSIGDTQWREDKPLRTSMVEVASVQGNTVRLVNGLAFDFDGTTTVKQIEVAQNVRLGGFSVDSGLADPDPASFTNVESTFDRSNVISTSAAAYTRLFDIDVRNAPSNGFTFAQTAFLEASNLTVEGAVNKGDGGNGYAFQLRALYDSNLAGLEAFDTRHALLFASWTSEANNTISVRATNRDINFHGGPDHHNTVEVVSSVRDATEATYLSPTLFVNNGTDYGAPTDMSTNTVTFRTVSGTTKGEVLVADPGGAELYANSGPDVLIGGAGNDRLYAEKGDDLVFGSGGSDVIDGGPGSLDVLQYDGVRDEFVLTRDWNGRLVIHKADGGYDIVGGMEALRFDDGTVAVSTLGELPHTYFGTDDADYIVIQASDDVVLSDGGFDRISAGVTYALGAENEALELTGDAEINGFGNDLANTFTGNDAANDLFGFGGADRFFARGGNDYLSGGEGNDELYGQAGNDRLYGSEGADLLNGGAGADTFVFAQGLDTVQDFSLRSGDRVDIGLTGYSAAGFFSAFEAAASTTGDTLTALGVDVDAYADGVTIRAYDANGHELAMSLNGTSITQLLSGYDWLI